MVFRKALLLGFIGVSSLRKRRIWAFAWWPSIGLSFERPNIGVTFLGKWSFVFFSMLSPWRLRQKCGFQLKTAVFGWKNCSFSENCSFPQNHGFHVVSLKAQTEMWFLIKNCGIYIKNCSCQLKTIVFAENQFLPKTAGFDGFCNHEV